MTAGEDIHFVVHISVEEVQHGQGQPVQRIGITSSEGKRKILEVGKVTSKDKNLQNAITKAKKHLDIIGELESTS